MSPFLPPLPPEYFVRFADDGHCPIATWEEWKNRCGYTTLGLYYNNVLIGTGSLEGRAGRTQRTVQTHAMQLRKAYRRQGHGLYLYLAMLHTARAIGADVIRSSYNLNKFSRRMWKTKLAEFCKVGHRGSGCRRCGSGQQYFIQLTEKK